MVKNFEANDTAFIKLFDKDNKGKHRLYKIPEFQRPYTWKKDNIEEFFQDLISKENENNFIGNIVAIVDEKNFRSEIVDGQQRITTILLLVSALRKYIQRKMGDYRNNDILNRVTYNLQSTYLFAEPYRIDGKKASQEQRIKFIPNNEMKKQFIEYIIDIEDKHEIFKIKKLTKKDEQFKNAYNNFNQLYELIDNVLSKLDYEEQVEMIEEIIDKINYTQVIFTSIKDETIAYEIFETMNARNVPLTASDLVKNYLFQLASKNKLTINNVNDTWIEITKNVNNSILNSNTTFLRYYFNAREELVSEKFLFRKLRKHITNQNFKKFLKELTEFSENLSILSDSDLSRYNESFENGDPFYNKKIMSSINTMNDVFRSKQQLMLLLSLYYKREIIKKRELYKIVKYIEYFTFLYFVVCKKRANVLDKIYSDYAQKIYKLNNTKNVNNDIKKLRFDLFDKLRKLLPTEDEFKQGFNELTYSNSNRVKIKHLLKHYNPEETSGDSDEISINEGITLEHVYPNTPPKGIKIEKSLHEGFKNKIGNLVLLGSSANGALNNNPVYSKIEQYEKSEIITTKKLAEELKDRKKLFKSGKIEIKNYVNFVNERTDRLAKIIFDNIVNEKMPELYDSKK